MYKLWSGFQTEYRLSGAYEVSVVLIESTHPARMPLPVLQRGAQDQGVFVIPGPMPVLSEVRPPQGKPAASLGDSLFVRGSSLEWAGLVLRLRHSLPDTPVELTPLASRTPGEVQVKIPAPADDPAAPSKFAAGVYTLQAVVPIPDLPSMTSNALPFALAPRISRTAPAGGTAPQGDVTVSIECIPQVRSEQRVVLLFGSQEIVPQMVSTPADPSAPSTLDFLVEGAQPGEYVLRLRIEGVDSVPVDFTTTPPTFAADQKVTVTP
jgi:hypothetical protein